MHHVGVGAREGLHLLGVVVPGLLRRHQGGAVVAVAARPDAAAHDDVDVAVQLAARSDEALDREAVRVGQGSAAVTEQVAPVGAGPPGGRFDDEPRARLRGHLRVLEEVAVEASPPGLVTQQRHRREVGQVETVVKDQRGLDAGVGEEHRCPPAGGVRSDIWPSPSSARSSGFRRVCHALRAPEAGSP